MNKPTNTSSRIAREGDYVVFPDGTSQLAEDLPKRGAPANGGFNEEVSQAQGRRLVADGKMTKEQVNEMLKKNGMRPI